MMHRCIKRTFQSTKDPELGYFWRFDQCMSKLHLKVRARYKDEHKGSPRENGN